MVWGKAGSTTLTGAGDVITVNSLSNNKCIMILNNVFSTGQGKLEPTLNNDTGSNYAIRYGLDGAAEVTLTSSTDFENTTGGFTNGLTFHVQYLVNIATEEKLLISHSCEVETTGAGTAPRKREYVGKWANTSDAVSRYDVPNVGSGDFASDSNSTVIGSDLTPAAAITFPTNVQLGSRAEITDIRKIYFRMDSDYVTDKWFEAGTLPYAGGRGVFNAGYIGSNVNVLDYVTIDTTGNATDFGDLTVSRRNSGVCANKTRGIICGGYSSNYDNTMDYITIATVGNAVDFGDFGDTQTNGIMGIGSETRACFGGGETSMTNRIAYVTIATPSNSTDFGDLTVARKGGGTTGDGTKGIWMGGEESGTHGVTMDYVTIATTGNASDWGDLSTGSAATFVGLVSDGTIGLLALGVGFTNQVDKKTISTNANSTDYGDLTQGRQQGGQCSTETRAVFGGGKFTSGASSGTNTIDYMAISTGGTATDFGDLTQARYLSGGMSDTGADRT